MTLQIDFFFSSHYTLMSIDKESDVEVQVFLIFYAMSTGKYALTLSKIVLPTLTRPVTYSHYSPWIFLALNGAFTFTRNVCNCESFPESKDTSRAGR